MKVIIQILVFLIMTVVVSGQVYWDKAYPSTGERIAGSGISFNNKYFISMREYCPLPLNYEAQTLMILNEKGEIVQEIFLDEHCQENHFFNQGGDVLCYDDHNLYTVLSVGDKSNHFQLLKLNTEMEVQFDSVYTYPDRVTVLRMILGNNDDLYLVLTNWDKSVMYDILRIDSGGNIINQKSIPFFGRDSLINKPLGVSDTELHSSGELWIFSDVISDPYTKYQHFVTVLDSNLNVIHRLHHEDLDSIPGREDAGAFATSGAKLKDVGFVIGHYKREDLWVPPYNYRHSEVWCFENDGRFRWKHTFLDTFRTIISDLKVHPENGNIYGIGHTDMNPDTMSGFRQHYGMFFFSLSPSGDLLWRRDIYKEVYNTLVAVAFDFTPDGGFIVTGYIDERRSGLPRSFIADAYVIKLDEYGCPYPNCQGEHILLSSSGISPSQSDDYQFTPNPSEGDFQVSSEDGRSDDSYVITDMMGRIVDSGLLSGDAIHIDDQGVFIIQVFRNNQIIQVEKLVVR